MKKSIKQMSLISPPLSLSEKRKIKGGISNDSSPELPPNVGIISGDSDIL